MKNKGVSEIISQILLMLITVVVVGLITAVIVPQLTRSKSQIKFEESQKLIDDLYDSVEEVYNSPVGYIKEVSFSLDGMTLNIDGNTDTIEIYSLIEGNFYKDGLRQERGNGRYTYRQGQKLYAGFVLDNIDLVRSYTLENQQHVSIYLKKTDKDKITVLLENTVEDDWFSPAKSNLGLYEESPGVWQYRKKILIDHNKVDGNLTNFPVLIYLEDSDLNLYANSDGNDIIFTSKDGRTKLKREIESFETRAEYRKKIIIDKDKVDGNLTNFPVLISIIDENLASFAQSDGKDIYFTASDGTTRLKREIEDYNSTTGTLVAWVKVPELSSTIDTNIFMYFGNQDENNTNDTDVWDSNYLGVWHSQDYNSTTILDSTNNNKIGTKASANNPIETSGKIGNAQNYTGDDYITISSTTIQTASFWANFNSVNHVQYLLGGSTQGIRYNGTDFLVYNGSSGYIALNWAKEDAWKYITVTMVNTNDYNFYIDGNLLGIATAGTNGADINITLIGKRADGYFFNGPIDEVRISNSTRSESWIKTEYNNQYNPSEFYTIDEMETIITPHKELFAWVKIPELSSVDDTAIYMYFGNPSANESNDKGVWDNDYVLVNHVSENSVDSTINNNNGTKSNITYTSNNFNQPNSAYFFNGTNSEIYSNDPDFGLTKGTFSFWIYKVGNSKWQGIFAKMTDTKGYKIGLNSSNRLNLMLRNGSGDYVIWLDSSSIIPLEEWTYITVAFNDSNQSDAYIYINGNLNKTGKLTNNTTVANNYVFDIGHSSSTGLGAGYLYGALDYIKISKIARSSSWIKTEYNNQSIPEGFIKVGILEKQ